MKLYRIMNKTTGLFSKGSSDADTNRFRWNKNGKIWTSIGALKCHLNMYLKRDWQDKEYKNEIPNEWVVMEFINGNWSETMTARSLYPETIQK